MRALYVGPNSGDLNSFVDELQRSTLFGPFEERHSDNMPGRRYFKSSVGCARLFVCEDDPDRESEHRFLLFYEIAFALPNCSAEDTEKAMIDWLEKFLKKNNRTQIADL